MRHRLLSVLCGFGLMAGLVVAAPVVGMVPEARATEVVTEDLPFDVVFESPSGTESPLAEADYVDYMATMAQWWTREARGLLGPVSDPVQTSTRYGLFTWPSYDDVKRVANSDLCATPAGVDMSRAAAAWERPSGAYGSSLTLNPDHRRLLKIVDDKYCQDGYVAGMTFGPSEPGFPGSGEIFARVNGDGYPYSDALNGKRYSVATLIHEMGHTFGLSHSLGGFACSDGLDGRTYGQQGDAADCLRPVTTSYGDDTNIMGNSWPWETTGLNGYQKYLLGIIDDGRGLATHDSTESTTYTMVKSDTASVADAQALRVVDSQASPLSEYWVDYPDSYRCTVRVLRGNPTFGAEADRNAAWQATLVGGLKNVGNAVADTLKVDTVHPGSSEQCLIAGDSYTTWSGTTITVDDVTDAAATVTVTPPPVPELSVSWDANLTPLSRDGSQQTQVSVDSNTSWRVVSKPDWMTVTPMSGDASVYGIDLSVSANPGSSPRRGELVVETTSGSPVVSRSVVIEQQGADLCGDLYGSGSDYSQLSMCTWSDLSVPMTGVMDTMYDSDGYGFVVPVSGEWTFTVSTVTSPALGAGSGYVLSSFVNVYEHDNSFDEYGGYYSLGQGTSLGQGVDVRVTAELTAGERYWVTMTAYAYGYGDFTITATPPPTRVDLESAYTMFVGPQSTYGWISIQIEPGEIGWAVVSAPDWVTVRPTSGSGVAYMDVVPNDDYGPAREGSIVVEAGGVEVSVPVSQSGDDCGGPYDYGALDPCSLTAGLAGAMVGSGSGDYGGETDSWVFTAPASGAWSFTIDSTAISSGGWVELLSADGSSSYGYASNSSGDGVMSFEAELVAGEEYLLNVSMSAEADWGQYGYTVTPTEYTITATPPGV